MGELSLGGNNQRQKERQCVKAMGKTCLHVHFRGAESPSIRRVAASTARRTHPRQSGAWGKGSAEPPRRRPRRVAPQSRSQAGRRGRTAARGLRKTKHTQSVAQRE